MESGYRRSVWCVLGCAAIIWSSGCADPVQPGAELVAGEYVASHFVIRGDAGTIHDLIQTEVGGVDMALGRTGGLTAALIVPVALSDQQEVPIQVRGSWSLADGVLSLAASPSTFLDEVAFAVGEAGELHAEWPIASGVVELRLTRLS